MDALTHEGVEYAPFITIYRRADAVPFGPRRLDQFAATYTDPEALYEITATGPDPYIALAKLQDAQAHEVLSLITGRNGQEKERSETTQSTAAGGEHSFPEDQGHAC